MPFYFDQLILRFFESLRCDFLTVFFGAFSLLGEGFAVGIVVILLYWLLPQRDGEQILSSALTCLPLNCYLKFAVARPRPYTTGVVSLLKVDTPLFSTTDLGDTLSFPSGHAQASSNWTVSVALRKKYLWVRVLVPVYIFFMLCSRLYFGVHYPTDLLAGLLFGVCLSLLWEAIFRTCPRARYFILCGAAVLALVMLFFPFMHDYAEATGMLAGAAFFLPLANLISPREPTGKKRLLRVLVGGAAAGIALALSLLLPKGEAYTVLKWFLLLGVATLGAQALFKALKI